jgi:hypothetical protein
VAAAVVGFAIYAVTGTISIVVPAVVAAAVLLLESFVASEGIGRLLDRMDVSAIDAQE